MGRPDISSFPHWLQSCRLNPGIRTDGETDGTEQRAQNTPSHQWSTDPWQGCRASHRKAAFPASGAGKLGVHMQKTRLGLNPMHIQKLTQNGSKTSTSGLKLQTLTAETGSCLSLRRPRCRPRPQQRREQAGSGPAACQATESTAAWPGPSIMPLVRSQFLGYAHFQFKTGQRTRTDISPKMIHQ